MEAGVAPIPRTLKERLGFAQARAAMIVEPGKEAGLGTPTPAKGPRQHPFRWLAHQDSNLESPR
jgi:hypothetical protein